MLLQAIVLHKLILFMPVLYIVFGLPLDAFLGRNRVLLMGHELPTQSGDTRLGTD